MGAFRNFQYCLGRAGGEYVKVMTDDDVLHSRALEETVAALDRQPRAGLVHTGLDRLGPGDEPLLMGFNWTRGLWSDTVEPGERFIREKMRWSCRVELASALVRAEAIPTHGYLEADRPASDVGLWLRMAERWDVAFLANPS